MSAVRTLPIRVPPLPGEAIDSWLEAIANRSQTAWDDLLMAVALHLPNNSSNRWVIQLTDRRGRCHRYGHRSWLLHSPRDDTVALREQSRRDRSRYWQVSPRVSVGPCPRFAVLPTGSAAFT